MHLRKITKLHGHIGHDSEHWWAMLLQRFWAYHDILNLVVVGLARWCIQTACIFVYEIDVLTCKNHHRHPDFFRPIWFRLRSAFWGFLRRNRRLHDSAASIFRWHPAPTLSFKSNVMRKCALSTQRSEYRSIFFFVVFPVECRSVFTAQVANKSVH